MVTNFTTLGSASAASRKPAAHAVCRLAGTLMA
jgi:hypothetical protein